MNRRLGRCPTCKRGLDGDIRRAMGLRNGEALNALCPGLNGPSDIDNVIHNGHVVPERVVFLEYKARGVGMSGGQARLLNALKGDWRDEHTGRRIAIRYVVLDEDDETRLDRIVAWVWPETRAAA